MYISLDWISQYVQISDISPQEIASRLTISTAEVESTETISRSLTGVVIGKVIAAEPLTTPTATGKKYTLCTVDCKLRTYQTVCGAANARVGLVAPFAPAGTTLHGGVPLTDTEVAGHRSEGVLCSAAEIGLSSWHEAVFECPADTPIGTPLSHLIPATDTLVEIDNKSLTHRPDLWGHYGIAREIAAIFGRPLNPLPLHDVAVYDSLPKYDVEVVDLENLANTPCYGCIKLDLARASATVPSPIAMQYRLHALGQRTYNLLVDVTNYVNLELGQPTHAFDGGKVTAIRVAPMGEKGKFRTLDGQVREMLPDDLMIWGKVDGNITPVAIAGIMGGQETEVTDTTSQILLESANFRAGRIRRTASRLDLRTDASQRFEKSQPPFHVRIGAQRILQVLADSGCSVTASSEFTVIGDEKSAKRTITLPPGRLTQLAGIDIPHERVLSILHSLGFEATYTQESLVVSVPPFRSEKDISIPEDIVEEVLRIYGYDNIPVVMPVSSLRPLFVEESIKLEHKARRILAAAHRFTEVQLYCWMNEKWTAKLGYEPVGCLELRNPAAQGDGRMRTSLLPNLFAMVPKNKPFRDQFRCFEIGHIYREKQPADGAVFTDSTFPSIEKPRLAGISFLQSGTPPEEHYLSVKAAVEDLGHLYGGEPFRFVTAEETRSPWEVAFHFAKIFQGETEVGWIGVADQNLHQKVGTDGGQLVFFELWLDVLTGSMFPTVKFTEPPKFPGSWQDFSVLWSVETGYSALERKMATFQHPLLKRREFLVSYQGKGVEKGMASYSFRYEIGADDHTLSREEIDGFHAAILAFLKANDIPLRV